MTSGRRNPPPKKETEAMNALVSFFFRFAAGSFRTAIPCIFAAKGLRRDGAFGIGEIEVAVPEDGFDLF